MFFGKGKKVIELVEEHLNAVDNCFRHYVEAIELIVGGCDKKTLESLSKTQQDMESEADRFRHQTIQKMLEGGLLVESRKSLMRIIEKTDMVADYSEDIIGKLYQESMEIPSFIVEPIQEINKITLEQFKLLSSAIKQVLYSYTIDALYQDIRHIESLESKVDHLQKDLIFKIFRKDYELAYKLHLKELINEIASISDLIEDISDDIEIVMLSRKV